MLLFNGKYLHQEFFLKGTTTNWVKKCFLMLILHHFILNLTSKDKCQDWVYLLLCFSCVSLAWIILNFLLYLNYTNLVTNSALTLNNYCVLAFQTLTALAFYLAVFWPITICSLLLRNDSKKGKREGKEDSSTIFPHSLKPLP